MYPLGPPGDDQLTFLVDNRADWVPEVDLAQLDSDGDCQASVAASIKQILNLLLRITGMLIATTN